MLNSVFSLPVQRPSTVPKILKIEKENKFSNFDGWQSLWEMNCWSLWERDCWFQWDCEIVELAIKQLSSGTGSRWGMRDGSSLPGWEKVANTNIKLKCKEFIICQIFSKFIFLDGVGMDCWLCYKVIKCVFWKETTNFKNCEVLANNDLFGVEGNYFQTSDLTAEREWDVYDNGFDNWGKQALLSSSSISSSSSSSAFSISPFANLFISRSLPLRSLGQEEEVRFFEIASRRILAKIGFMPDKYSHGTEIFLLGKFYNNIRLVGSFSKKCKQKTGRG